MGILGSRLFVPYFPLSESAQAPIPPFVAYIDWSNASLMISVAMVTLLLIEGIVLVHMRRARVFEILRLG